MDKAKNRKLIARLARQLGQAADQAARHKERNPHVDIEPAARAAMKIAARRFARRELRPIITRRQQEKETDRLHEEAMQRMKPAGCYDQRGNKIPCPVQYRAYESVVSATRAYFDDFGNLVREEVVGNIAVETPMKQTSSSNPVWGYGLEASLLGDALAFGDHFTYNKDFWLGKNGKFYGSNWGGNKYTGGKYKFAKKLGNVLGKSSSLLGVYSVLDTYNDETISDSQKTIDQTVNGIGFLGAYGAAFNFGFNLGYVIEDACDCNIQLNPRYFNYKYIKRNGWRFDKFFEDPDRPYRSVFED